MLKLGTRKSPLAMRQSTMVADALKSIQPGLEVELIGFQTSGDAFLEKSLQAVGGKGLFVKELEEALLAETIDFAVHSMKDMPPDGPEGLTLLPFGRRENPSDAFVSIKYASLKEMPEGSVIGTSSVRRQVLINHSAPHLKVELLRGNIHTRLQKLAEGQYDAILLATAGLKRMGLESRIREELPVTEFIPSCGQGLLAVQCRQGDVGLLKLLSETVDFETMTAWLMEKAFQRAMGADCHTPMGAYASRLPGGEFQLLAFLADSDSEKLCFESVTVPAAQTVQAAEKLAQTFKSKCQIR